MADTYVCRLCGYTAATGAGSLPSICPECGGNNLTLKKAGSSPAEPAAPAPPPAEEEEEE